MTAPLAGDRPAPEAVAGGLGRVTATMTALTVLSRLTGFARIVVVAAVLGTTFLGNTYQSANTVPNLLFELFAAGALQATLIPTLVALLDAGDRREAEHVAGSVLGLASVVLGVLAVLGIVLAPWVMRVLVVGVEDAAIRDAEVELGTFLLWFFLPQVVLYAAGTVSTAVLNARGRFALPVFAPVVNNVVVTATYGVFWWLRDGAPPSLDLDLAEKLVLAGGTTLGVLTFCAVPIVAVVRGGFSLRPRLDHRHPEVRLLARRGGWAVLYLAVTQVLLAVVLVLANRVEGGVVTYQVAFTFFLLPHALFAIPVFTALYPRMARQAQQPDGPAYRRSVERGLWAVSFFLLPASAALVVLAGPLTRLLLFGETAGAGARQVADTLAAFGPGLLGYGVLLLLARAFYALGDTKTPALLNAGVVAAGAAAMAVAFAVLEGDARIPGLAGSHSAVHLAGAATLFALLRRRVADGWAPRVPPEVVASAVAALVAGLVGWLACALLDGGGRAGAAAGVAGGGLAMGASYLVGQRLLGGPHVRDVVSAVQGRAVGGG